MASTIFNANANAIGIQFGTPGVDLSNGAVPIYAATVTGDLANNGFVLINAVAATSATCTLNVNKGYNIGQMAQVLVKDTGGITLTFGTNMKPSATVAPTTGKAIAVDFTFDGTNWVESGRGVTVTY
jgi:hypothetical protein